MKPLLNTPLFLITAVLLLAGPSTVGAGTAGIHDNAGFFSDRAKADAAYNVTEVQRSLHRDICLETFKEIPAEVRQGTNLQDSAAVTRITNQWGLQRAREQSVNGVYILLVKEPAHLQVLVGNETQKQAFTLADREHLVSLMLTKLRAKDYDGALREGLSFVATTMRSHTGGHARTVSAPSSVAHEKSGGGWLLPLILVGVVAWVVIGVLRSIFRPSQPMNGPQGPGMTGGGMLPGQAGGGGFMKSMLGGMFGSMAGMWLFDQFSGSHGSAFGANQQDRYNDGNNSDGGFSGQDTDYSGSGGDFGSDSGSDSGGFDGGGDSGGGGDF